MKILHQNKKEGVIKVRPETLDDLWYLKGLICQGDFVRGKGYRRVRDDEKLRADKGVRVPMTLGLRVESVEFAPYVNRLRITGVIEEGPEDLISLGSHQTIDIKPTDTLTIVKERWKNWELDRLKDAVKAGKTPLVLIVCVEDGEAEFAVVRSYGIDFPARITVTVSGKREIKEQETTKKEFFSEVGKKLEEVMKKEDIKACILAGPGFTKDGLINYLKDKHPTVAGKCRLESAGTGGRVGISEIIKKGVVERIAKESRVSYETLLVEQLFSEIGKESGLGAYGPEEVRKALDIGAVEKLLVTDTFLRKDKNADTLLEGVRKTGGEGVIISTEHNAGERLEGIGGVGAILRYAV
jgi:protein pelota